MEVTRRVYTYALAPDSQENSRVMHDDIEEEKVADNTSRKREYNDIYDLVPATLRLINSADAFCVS